jgi:hypothetical protein
MSRLLVVRMRRGGRKRRVFRAGGKEEARAVVIDLPTLLPPSNRSQCHGGLI